MAPLTPWTWPTMPWPWTRVHIDCAEQGKQYFLIVVDAHSRWPEIVPVQNATSHTTINVLRDLFSKYGIPLQIVSDNGPQFCSVEFATFLKSNGVKHIRVAPYHAASNGLAERHSYYSRKQDQMSMQQSIANFLLIYRSTTHPTTGYTPAKLFLGRELRTRLSLIKPETQSNVMTTQGRQKDYHDLHSKYREFYPGDAVLVKDLRKDKTWWPGTVVERSTPKLYVIVLSDGRVWKRHVDHLHRKDCSSTESPRQVSTQKDPITVTISEEEIGENVNIQGNGIDTADQGTSITPVSDSDVSDLDVVNPHQELAQHSIPDGAPDVTEAPVNSTKILTES